MRHRLLSASFTLLLPACLLAQEPDVAPPQPTMPAVAVLPFDNLDQNHMAPEKAEPEKGKEKDGKKKGWRLPSDGLAEACRLAIEQLLIKRSAGGLRVVERNRLSRALEELELHQSPLADQDTAVQLGKYIGARYLVTGAVQPIEVKEVEVTAYDLNVKNVIAKAEVLVKVLDVETSQLLFSETFKGSNTIRSTKYRKEEAKDRDQLVLPAVKDALKQAQASDDLRKFLDKLNPNAAKAGMVMLDVAPVPEGCDIEVDGLFVGNSPMQVEVPLDKVVTLKLSMAGYGAWEKQMKASKELAGRKIAPTLKQDQPPVEKPAEGGGEGKGGG